MVLFAATPSLPSVSATGCVNVTHDVDGPQLLISPSTTDVGVSISVAGQVVAVGIVPANCQIPPGVVQHFVTDGGQVHPPVALLP